MVWKYNDCIVRVGRSWSNDDGITHPSNWSTVWSDEDKTAAGLVWEEETSVIFDSRFYLDAETPKSLNDVNETWSQKEIDEEIDIGHDMTGISAGDPKLDSDGNQIVNLGLKTIAINNAKAQASMLLSKTDWYVVRKSETGEAIPADVVAHRASVRSACDTIETSITNAADLDAFIALHNAPVDENNEQTGPAPINDFPEAF